MAEFGRRKDLTNQRFGQLVVLEFAYATDKNAYWKCRCDCGKETTLAV